LTQAQSILDRRRAGILLHITSLPGELDCGDLGAEAKRFVDFLVSSGCTLWQTLPIGPPHEDRSPYQCMSVHAGDPQMINLEWLLEKGWLKELLPRLEGESSSVYRLACLKQAYAGFLASAGAYDRRMLERFRQEQAHWLEDYALFVALREEYGRTSWHAWPQPLRDRQAEALAAARVRLAAAVDQVCFEQFVFFRQWQELRAYAKSRGVILFGDMPIFVACDSADVWAQREYFDLDEAGQPRVVAGVPPDYFSAVGQRWGNPHYNWARMEEDGFSWWIERVRGQMALYDWVRIDHFRGFEAFWEIPADQETAIQGRWVKAPGEALLRALFGALDGVGLPLVAENLGVITPEVEALREQFHIPGMLILQFAFDGGPDNPYLPANHVENDVVYTGTHDNDTSLSWYQHLSPEQRQVVDEHLAEYAEPMPWALVCAALASRARLAILPMQDVMGLGEGHRMNQPGTMGGGNWRWRFHWDQVSSEHSIWLGRMIRRYDRV
jgi:4-alpha-glucanotransferase